MIRRVHFANFRALRDVWLDLEPFTVLVGPNASGKSSVLDALDWDRGITMADRYERAHDAQVTIDLDDASRIERVSNRASVSHLATQVIHLDLAQMRAARQVLRAQRIERDGSNIVNVLYGLPRTTQADVAAQLAKLITAVADVDHKATTAGHHQLVFQDRWNEGSWHDASQVSDGTLYALGYLLLRYQHPRPVLLCVEEPERSLHPYLIGEIVTLLRSMTTGERPMQVIIATQSAELLEHVTPPEVRFFGRDERGAVTIRRAPIDEPGWDEAVREYSGSVGQMWLSGGLGGVPAV